jgi:hypothetical protein
MLASVIGGPKLLRLPVRALVMSSTRPARQRLSGPERQTPRGARPERVPRDRSSLATYMWGRAPLLLKFTAQPGGQQRTTAEVERHQLALCAISRRITSLWLSPRPLVGFGWRRGLRGRRWLEGQRRVEPRHRRAQRIQAWGVGISVAFDDATDCRCYRGQLVGGEVNRRHSSGYNRPTFVQQGDGRRASRRRGARFTDLVAPA